MEKLTKHGHRWSGWPGAYCMDCGSEVALATRNYTIRDGMPVVTLTGEQLYCSEHMSNRYNPYVHVATPVV